jgi:hypothetical protein
MAIALTGKYLAELKKGANTPSVVVELALDSGIRRFGFHGSNSTETVRYLADGSYLASGEVFAVGTDELSGIEPSLKSISSLQNKLDVKSGYSTRGRLSFVLGGSAGFLGILSDEHLKNRRVTRKDGFIAHGFTYADYASTFTGRIIDWSRSGEELTVVVSDELKDASRKIPQENDSRTQYLDYRDTGPAEIMKDLLLSELLIEPEFVDIAAFDQQAQAWLGGVRFSRVLTESKSAGEYLNELQTETNSFIIHDGAGISFRVLAPPAPGEGVEEWTDERHILDGSFRQKSGYADGFFNRVVLYYDYDESEGDNSGNYESVVITADASSQSGVEWNEVKSKVIKSRWIRSLTYSSSGDIGGVVIYHASVANGIGTGTLSYDSFQNTLSWAAPGEVAGGPVKVARDGKYQIKSQDGSMYLRVLVNTALLPAQNATDIVTITAMDGDRYADSLSKRLLNRYRDPVSTVAFEVDINGVAYSGSFIRPTDLKDLTTTAASNLGGRSWNRTRVMLTSVRPDFSTHRIAVEAVETRMYRRYGFIAPAGFPDYTAAVDQQKVYAFIGDASGKVGGGSDDGYYAW